MRGIEEDGVTSDMASQINNWQGIPSIWFLRAEKLFSGKWKRVNGSSLKSQRFESTESVVRVYRVSGLSLQGQWFESKGSMVRVYKVNGSSLKS